MRNRGSDYCEVGRLGFFTSCTSSSCCRRTPFASTLKCSTFRTRRYPANLKLPASAVSLAPTLRQRVAEAPVRLRAQVERVAELRQRAAHHDAVVAARLHCCHQHHRRGVTLMLTCHCNRTCTAPAAFTDTVVTSPPSARIASTLFSSTRMPMPW